MHVIRGLDLLCMCRDVYAIVHIREWSLQKDQYAHLCMSLHFRFSSDELEQNNPAIWSNIAAFVYSHVEKYGGACFVVVYK